MDCEAAFERRSEHPAPGAANQQRRVNRPLTPNPYAGAMTPSPARPLLAIALCALALPASAITVSKVEVKGLANEDMHDNVMTALSLQDETEENLSARRLNYLLRIAEDETRQALEPFGYYSPTITIHRSDREQPVGAAQSQDADTSEARAEATPANTLTEAEREARRNRSITVTIQVDPGQPVRVRHYTVDVSGPAREDRLVDEALGLFAPRQGDVLDHTLYDTSRDQVSRALTAHGYFDAEFAARKVEVTRADFAADIDLRWTSGERYALGGASFTQEPKPIIRDELLQRLVNWEPGETYDEDKLEKLRRSLVGLDYFGLVDVSPEPEKAEGKQVPVAVTLSPAPRSIYSAGVSYGTQSGAGISLGMQRRYLNSRGHKALAQLDYADKRKTLTLQYRVPAFAWLDGWYSGSLQAADEQTDYVNSRRLEFIASRSGQFNDHLNLVASAHVLRERWAYTIADDATGTSTLSDFTYASFVYPSLRAEYIDVDDRLAPRRGAGGTLTLRGGKGGADGDATFAQLHATAAWFKGFDADSRLIVRGEAGHTFTDDVLALPPSLRYYAGGDRSVRGYGWHEIGPRVETAGGSFFTGAPNVFTGSIEYERYFLGPWGAAIFIDSGSAFEGKSPDMRTGVGIGLRWRSPVGPVRIDLARGLDSPDSPFTIHLNIGADL